MATLFGLPNSQAPFGPALTGNPPNDFTIGINYTGGGINHPSAVAIDTFGNAWITNTTGNSVTKLTPLGVPATGTPFTDPAISSPRGIAIDPFGYAYVADYGSNSVTRISNDGSTIFSNNPFGIFSVPSAIAVDSLNSAWVTSQEGGPQPALVHVDNGLLLPTGYAVGAGGMDVTNGVAIDFLLNQWISNGTGTVTELLAGVPTLNGPYGLGTFSSPSGIAIDALSNAWIADAKASQVVKITQGGGTLLTYTGGGLDGALGIAIDGSQNVWMANNSGLAGNRVDGLSEFTAAGLPQTPSTGYLGGSLYFPTSVAIDGSGDVWATDQYGFPVAGVPNTIGSVTELIGAAIPVVTPIASSLLTPYPAPASKP